jgi:branched-chain amino acid transport system permease protein
MTTSRSVMQVRRFSTPVLLIGIMLIIALISELRRDVVFERVVTVMFINLMLAVALQVFQGNSGLGNFGQYAFVTIGAYASIWFSLTQKQKRVALPDMPQQWWLYKQHWDFIPAIVGAAAIATVVGAVIGVAFVRLRGASFTIATFAFLIVINRVALQWTQLTKGATTVFGIPKYTGPWDAMVWASLGVLVAYCFKESPLGLKLRASREDEDAAETLGVNTALMRWSAWTLSVFLTAVAGALWAHFIQNFSPHNFYLKETFLVVAMLIIGGSGSVSGAVIGAIAVAMSQEGLRQIENWLNIQRSKGTWVETVVPFQVVGFTEIIIAIGMILVLIVRPSGITRGREIAWPRLKQRTIVDDENQPAEPSSRTEPAINPAPRPG